MIEKIKKWWNGEWNTYSDDELFAISNDKHWSSRIAHSIVDYIKKHQSWIIPTIITVVVSIILAKT
jgi:hypothetical protein